MVPVDGVLFIGSKQVVGGPLGPKDIAAEAAPTRHSHEPLLLFTLLPNLGLGILMPLITQQALTNT